MPPRSLTGTLFGAAAALWGLLVGVLVTLLAPETSGPSFGFWVGLVLAAAAGAGVGATGGHRLVQALPAGRRTGGVIRFAGGGVALLLGAGVVALAAGLLLAALAAGPQDVWSALRQGATRPERLAWPVAGVALIGVPIGAAAGVVLRAVAVPPSAGSAARSGTPGAEGSPRPPSR